MSVTLAIAIVSNRDWDAFFTSSLLKLILKLKNDPLGDNFIYRQKLQCSLLSEGRDAILADCLKEGATHVLCLDDDMMFPADIAHRLMAHGKRIVGINYALKTKGDMARVSAQTLDGSPCQKEGCEEVATIGFGAVLIDAEVLKVVPEPRFEVRWRRKTGYTGEDRYFCNKARLLGERIFVDHELSRECCHIGRIGYGLSG